MKGGDGDPLGNTSGPLNVFPDWGVETQSRRSFPRSTIPSQGIGAVALIFEGMAPNPQMAPILQLGRDEGGRWRWGPEAEPLHISVKFLFSNLISEGMAPIPQAGGGEGGRWRSSRTCFRTINRVP